MPTSEPPPQLHARTSNESTSGASRSTLTLDRSTLEKLLGHAASAARIAGSIDDVAIGPLADEIDAIVHELSELLGNPQLIAVLVPRAGDKLAVKLSTRRTECKDA